MPHGEGPARPTPRSTPLRVQSAASAGQILVTQEVYRRAQSDLAGSQAKACQLKACQLKGFEAPIELYAA